MLFFAKTTSSGDIDDYLLLMRASGQEYEDESTYLEINERQFSGQDLIREARLNGNVLTLELREPADELDGANEIVVIYDDTSENKESVEQGALQVLGGTLAGGRA